MLYNCPNHGLSPRGDGQCPQCMDAESQGYGILDCICNHIGKPQMKAQQKESIDTAKKSAFDHQEGGSHYKDKAIQPVEYCMANGIGFMEGSVIKYVTRWRDKGGVQDLKKARHFLDLLIEYEERK